MKFKCNINTKQVIWMLAFLIGVGILVWQSQSEMYKRERERLVHPFTHERGSKLAHVFPQDLVHERE